MPKAKNPRTSADELPEEDSRGTNRPRIMKPSPDNSLRRIGDVGPSPLAVRPNTFRPVVVPPLWPGTIGIEPQITSTGEIPYDVLPPAPGALFALADTSTNKSSKKGGKGRKTRKCKNDATFVWLNLWFKTEFEKLGWMVLARKKGYDEKVNAYINSVKTLCHQLECKIKDTRDHDKKQDLILMHKDVKYLMEHIYKDF